MQLSDDIVKNKEEYEYTPDTITVDGKEYHYDQEYDNVSARPILMFKGNDGSYTYEVGETEEGHGQMEFRLFRKLREKGWIKFSASRGRIWDYDGAAIFTFWNKDEVPFEELMTIMYDIAKEYGYDEDECYLANLKRPLKKLFRGMKIQQNSDDEKEALSNKKQIHTKEYDETEAEFKKRRAEQLSGFLTDKVKERDKKLKYDDKPGYMTDAEYRFRTSMDEESDEY